MVQFRTVTQNKLTVYSNMVLDVITFQAKDFLDKSKELGIND